MLDLLKLKKNCEPYFKYVFFNQQKINETRDPVHFFRKNCVDLL